MEEYFSFEKMVSQSLIKVIYLLGSIIITIVPILLIFNGIYPVGGMMVLVIFGIILGNLLWRVFCEAWIALFKILDSLERMEKKKEE